MEREHDSRPEEPREPYQPPTLVRHGTLEDLTAGQVQKAHQASTDQQSQPTPS